MATTAKIHIRAVEWAINKGYTLSVRDYSEEEYDLKHSTSRHSILKAIDATDLPNVEIWDGDRKVTTFAVDISGGPDETIIDYTLPREGVAEFDEWWKSAIRDY